jgi:hypothetical protein
MDIQEIRRIAIDSAENYFRFLDKNNRGIQEVQVYDIIAMPVTNDEPIYKLRLSAKLFDIEAVDFKLLSTEKRYSTGEIKIIEYDSDKNTLLIKPEIQLLETFKKLKASDIKVISDLKFLVERVKKWYELKGANIRFPEQASSLRDSFNQIKYLPNTTPSTQQSAALRLIFTVPFSYIWGAPGTGKTQFVLSYAALHYIEHKKRVAIMAPTNNAIEQVLRGVLKMTDKAGVARSKILRMGVPSRKFAEEYPEVCEERGLMKKLEELDKKIEKHKHQLAYVQQRDRLNKLSDHFVLFSKYEELHKKLQDSKIQLDKRQEEFIKTSGQLAVSKQLLTETKSREEVLIRKVNSLGTKITKLFTNKAVQAETELSKVREALSEINARLNYWETENKEKEKALNSEKSVLINTELAIKNLSISIREIFGITEELRNIVNSLNETNWRSIHTDLKKQLQKEKGKSYSLEGENDLLTAEEIEYLLESLQAIKNKLNASSTEERLKGVSIIAGTLDGYIGRFTETTLAVDHVFMDEAGYSNIIKALPLFTLKAPVTFLGDHKQLPPVCEINDSDMEQTPEYNNIFLWAQSAIFLEGLFIETASTLLMEYLQHKTIAFDGRMQRANLTHTFRFGQKLAKILDNHVYKNGFSSSLESGDTKIYFVHAPKTDGFKSRTSTKEVEVIRNLVSQLNKEEDFIILTPYKKQVDNLGRMMPNERNDLKILTVHGSQGREWNTVILSVVDTGDKWFVDSRPPLSNGLNLLNTAVSRTQKKLIIVCDYQFWKGQNGQLISDLLGVSEEIQLVI